MKKIAIAFLFFLAQMPFLTAANPNIRGSDLEAFISRIFEDFRGPAKVFNITLGNVVFSETLQTHAPNGSTDIVVKTSQLKNYTEGENDLFKRLFIEYVIAHEIAHKIQFAGYRKEVIEATAGEGSIFLECDADILAGLIMTNEINTVEVPRLKNDNPGFNLPAYTEKNNNAMFHVYERIFQMDQKNVDINTHPSHLQRLMAIREGIELGMCTIMAFVEGNSQDVVQAKDLYKNIGNAINFNPARNNPLVWAHDEAVFLTNENNSLARHLVIYDADSKRIRDAGQSHFDFSFKIFNENPVSVRFSCRVYTAVRPRTDQPEYIKKVPLDSKAFDQVVPPGSSIQFTGTVKYISEEGYTTNIILPGDPESVYFVMDAQNPKADYTQLASNDNNFNVWDENSLGNIDDHIKDMVDKSGQFSNYTKGIGVSHDKDIEQVQQGNRRFQSTFKAGLEESQDFVYNARKHRLIYKFYACESSDSNEVVTHFQKINQKIQSSFAGRLTPRDVEVEDDGASRDFVDSEGNVKITINVTKNYYQNKFVVEVSISGK
jgi:hypothetical protein